MLLERLLLGKYRGKQILVVGKPQSGKAMLMQCIATSNSVTKLHHDNAINSVQINKHTPGKENSKCLPKGPVDAIILCIRLDDYFRSEDQQLIFQLGRRFGKGFLKKTVIVLTMANRVKPVGALEGHSDHELLKMARDELKGLITEEFQRQKLKIPPQLNHRIVLAGATEPLPEGRMIPDIESGNDSWVDWIAPVAQALLNF